MAKTAVEVTESVQRFVKALEEGSHCMVDLVILYGSYARNEAHRLSDIDVAVISQEFTRIPSQRLREVVRTAEEASDRAIHALPYTREEYAAAPRQSFLGEIKRTGTVIYRYAA